MYNQKYMKLAIEESKKSLQYDEVPIGTVIVKNDKVISTGFNYKETSNIVTKHAEIIAIEKANKNLKNWRLNDCDLYVTLEPCPMCMSAIQQARIKNVYYGISNKDPLNAEIISKIIQKNNTNPGVILEGGYMQDEILLILTSFFKKKRNK